MNKKIKKKIIEKNRKMLKNFALGNYKKGFKQRLDMIKLWLKVSKE